ncbi:MAG: hypothetical protein GY903_33865 [Fuerstiella sp.]|nr:hypothetical protein [Fuerstiella sp.]MCP4859481.1 hypothetical protein [Fuerstiella sp.]
MLEIASGNQHDPIVWDSFRPPCQRGMWRFTVREEFGRLIGTVTNANDPSGIWVLSEWTPRGVLVLEPAHPGRYPRILAQPASPPSAL